MKRITRPLRRSSRATRVEASNGSRPSISAFAPTTGSSRSSPMRRRSSVSTRPGTGGVIFPLVFATLVYKRLPGTPIARGTLWGVVLWLAAQAIVMPMMGAGFFSTAARGAMAAMGSLVAHVLYGGVLGAVAGRPQPFTVAAIA